MIKNGGEAWVAMSLAAIYDDDGQSLGFRSSVRDITRAQEGGRGVAQIDPGVEQSQASILITDRDGAIEYVNPHFCRITGYTSEEA